MYLRTTRLVLNATLNACYMFRATNSCAVDLMRYEAGIVSWKGNELQLVKWRTHKLIEMNKDIHIKSDV